MVWWSGLADANNIHEFVTIESKIYANNNNNNNNYDFDADW